MIDFFTKLNGYVDYEKEYSIRKALTTIECEFKMAVVKSNKQYATQIASAAKQFTEKLSLLFGNTEDFQKNRLLKLSAGLSDYINRELINL